MSLSTTSTVTYLLAKYSRAYPSTTSTTEAEVEWQHFTNPVVRLILDIKRASDGELESYRVRVIWSLSPPGPDGMDVDQSEVVFEDIDLLSFTSPSTLENQRHNFATHGLPLKAVYRDAVVGIRYMYPRIINKGAIPMYRRFQINFQKTEDASNFVDAIKHVCPCKANAPPPPPRSRATLSARSMTMAPPAHSASASASANTQGQKAPSATSRKPMRSSATMQPSRLPVSNTLVSHKNVNTIAPPNVPQATRTVVSLQATTSQANSANLRSAAATAGGSSLNANISSAQKTLAISSSVMRMQSVSQESIPSSIQMPLQSSSNKSKIDPLTNAGANLIEPLDVPQPSFVPNPLLCSIGQQEAESQEVSLSSLPEQTQDLSEPYGSMQVDAPEPQHPPPVQTVREDFLKTLREEPALYSLTKIELESLVAKIVREDGFMQLLENIDSMWRVKAYMGMT